jgi:hypothetical protein
MSTAHIHWKNTSQAVNPQLEEAAYKVLASYKLTTEPAFALLSDVFSKDNFDPTKPLEEQIDDEDIKYGTEILKGVIQDEKKKPILMVNEPSKLRLHYHNLIAYAYDLSDSGHNYNRAVANTKSMITMPEVETFLYARKFGNIGTYLTVLK